MAPAAPAALWFLVPNPARTARFPGVYLACQLSHCPMTLSRSKKRRLIGPQQFTAAVVQAAPVLFDRDRTLSKVGALAAQAAGNGAKLVVFPEAFVSAYPRGLGFGAVVGSRSERGRDDFRRYYQSSVDVPGPAITQLCRVSGKNKIYLVIGVIERDRGTLY